MPPFKRLTLVLLSAGTAAAAGVLATGLISVAAANAAGPQLIYAAPNGSGTQCSPGKPCSITTAQQAARHDRTEHVENVQVILDDGTYRLTAPLDFGPGRLGQPRAPGACGAPRPAPTR